MLLNANIDRRSSIEPKDTMSAEPYAPASKSVGDTLNANICIILYTGKLATSYKLHFAD
jgi:hypothetical protein